MSSAEALFNQLRTQRSSAFTALHKTLEAPVGTRFNKESEARDKLKGDEVAAEISHKDRFGQASIGMPLAERWTAIERIDAIAEAKLPAGYGRLGVTALSAMLDELRTGTERTNRDAMLF